MTTPSPSQLTGERNPDSSVTYAAFLSMIADGISEEEAVQITAMTTAVGMDPAQFAYQLVRLRGGQRDAVTRAGV